MQSYGEPVRGKAIEIYYNAGITLGYFLLEGL